MTQADPCNELNKRFFEATRIYSNASESFQIYQAAEVLDGEELPVVYYKEMKAASKAELEAREKYFKAFEDLIECLKKHSSS